MSLCQRMLDRYGAVKLSEGCHGLESMMPCDRDLPFVAILGLCVNIILFAVTSLLNTSSMGIIVCLLGRNTCI